MQGQTRRVQVYRLVVEDSVESKFIKMRDNKESNTQPQYIAGAIANDKEKLKFEEYLELFG